ncbi:unnamed protein product [Cyprideis torosa]|uniref:Uncharacterized protein n=1 Tax=Cyprideis torosa TaxID=163714 RepID=A0A7R8W7M9_9CRUS|nr:unnamed protein product [Cyprideis torosa]CAG0886520.1 unnamed protein product [Cyprideis torosa]
MEKDVLDLLDDLEYKGNANSSEDHFKEVIQEGVKSTEFTDLVAWLSNELHVVAGLEEKVDPIPSPDDSPTFLLELSFLLKELGCPYSSLMEGSSVNSRLVSREDKLLLLYFLCGEVLAARMLSANGSGTSSQSPKGLLVPLPPGVNDLKRLLVALGFPKPPPGLTCDKLFAKVEEKVREFPSWVKATMAELPKEALSRPLLMGLLSAKQWAILDELSHEMKREYTLRREMLLKRLDVTIQSFKWADRLKPKEEEINRVFIPMREKLRDEPDVSLGDLLAAREDLAIQEKTSSASVRKHTKSKVNRVIIGNVPDRGGRPSEAEPPPPEMPSWMQRQPGPPRGGGRGGGGDYRGGRGDHRGSGGGRGGGAFHGGGGGGYHGGGGGGYQGGGYQQHDYRGGGGYSNNTGGGGYGGGGYDQYGGGYQQQYGADPYQHPQQYHRGGGGRGRVQGGWSGGGEAAREAGGANHIEISSSMMSYCRQSRQRVEKARKLRKMAGETEKELQAEKRKAEKAIAEIDEKQRKLKEEAEMLNTERNVLMKVLRNK